MTKRVLTYDVEPDVVTHLGLGADLALVHALVRQLNRSETTEACC